MDCSIAPTGPPVDQGAPSDPLAQSLISLADRLTSLEADTANRFDAVRSAFMDLRTRNDSSEAQARSITDDSRRRLREFLGYEPTLQQQVELMVAYAGWHATKPKLQENRSAEYTTKKGQLVKYGFADLAAVLEVAQSAAQFGLCVFTRQEFDDNGHPIVTGYLVHIGGGAVSSGPVPLFVGESDRRGQAHAAGLTTCRRLATQMVLGLAAERDDDFNNSGEVGPAAQAISRPPAGGPRAVAVPPRRMSGATSRPVDAAPKGPPPGWLSKQERAALEQELQDPQITPERFQEIEMKLLAAQNSVQATGGTA
jgi:hypothetical protein